MTKKEIISLIERTKGILISLTNATCDFDCEVMDILRGLETLRIETENGKEYLMYEREER